VDTESSSCRFFPVGGPPILLDTAVRALILSRLTRPDRPAVEQFIERVEIILTWRHQFNKSTFPATSLRKIHTILEQAIHAIENASRTVPTTRDHLERALIDDTESRIAPRMALEWLKGYLHTLDAYLRLRSPKSPKGGRPPKAKTVATHAAMAGAYATILKRHPSAAERSPFAERLSRSPLKFLEWVPWLSHAAFFV